MSLWVAIFAIGLFGDRPPTADPSLSRFARHFLTLVKQCDAKNLRQAADLKRIEADCRKFSSGRNASAIPEDELIETWLEALDAIADDAWENAEVRRVARGVDGVANIRLRLQSPDRIAEDYYLKVVRDGGADRFIDVQRLPSGFSLALQAKLQFAKYKDAKVAPDLVECFRSFSEGAVDDPRRLVERWSERSPFMPQQDLLMLRWTVEESRHREALRRFHALSRGGDDDPAVAWLAANAYYQLEKYADAIRSVEWYESLVGPDASSRLLFAKTMRAQGRFAESRKACLEAIKDDPSFADAAVELFEATPANKKAEAASRLPKGDEFEEIAPTLGASLEAVGDVAGLRALVDRAESLPAPDAMIAYLRGELFLAQGNANDAAEAVAKHLPEDDDEWEEADDALDLYCDAMHRLGKALEAYRRLKTPTKAFAGFISKLDLEKDAKDCAALCAEHLAKRPTDALAVETYAGLLLKDKKAAEAVRIVDAYLAHRELEVDAEAESIRRLRLRLFLDGGKIDDAIRFIGNDEDLFDAAAEELADRGRVEDLARLIERSAPKADDPVLLVNWLGELAFLRKDYQAAISMLYVLTEPPNKPMLDDRRRRIILRTLIRQGMYFDSKKAEELPAAWDDFGLALAFAAAGDAARFEIALENCQDAGHSSTEFLADPDLGPLLKKPNLSKVFQRVFLEWDFSP